MLLLFLVRTMSTSIHDQNLEKTGYSCTCCNTFLVKQVKLEGAEKARLVSCGVCHRTWFRDSEESFAWRYVPHEPGDELEKLESEHETVDI